MKDRLLASLDVMPNGLGDNWKFLEQAVFHSTDESDFESDPEVGVLDPNTDEDATKKQQKPRKKSTLKPWVCHPPRYRSEKV